MERGAEDEVCVLMSTGEKELSVPVEDDGL